MLFNSLTYFAFLPIVFVLYWCVPKKMRWLLLLAASYFFYMSWNVKYVVLILFTTVVSYAAALLVENAKEQRQKKGYLAGALILCLAVLFVFKYLNFFSGSLVALFAAISIPLHPLTVKLLLPVGISFYTFQTLSYVIDVYRGELPAEHHFGKYAAFISFFPQLVAGPIERAGALLPQIKTPPCFDCDKAFYGIRLILWGTFKKVVIADTLAVYVDRIYNNLGDQHGLSLILATVFFAFQIYCDFSGYSDVAIGSARLFGINLMTNFKSPYFSASIKEFWSRWHISLSSWFRDYVYIPLGGNRVKKGRRDFNLLITFLLSGLWHGANWTFVIWGGIHAVAQILEHLLIGGRKERTQDASRFRPGWWIRVATVFIVCCFSWIFFRVQNLSEVGYIMRTVLDGVSFPITYIRSCYVDMGFTVFDVFKIASLLLLLGVYDYCSLKRDVPEAVGRWPGWLRLGACYTLLLLIFLFMPTTSSEFIYFDF